MLRERVCERDKWCERGVSGVREGGYGVRKGGALSGCEMTRCLTCFGHVDRAGVQVPSHLLKRGVDAVHEICPLTGKGGLIEEGGRGDERGGGVEGC